MSSEEEYQVVKRGMEYHGCGEDYNVEKREKGSNVPFPIILRLRRRISRGEGCGSFGEEIRDLKKLGWGRISSCRELYTPLL